MRVGRGVIAALTVVAVAACSGGDGTGPTTSPASDTSTVTTASSTTTSTPAVTTSTQTPATTSPPTTAPDPCEPFAVLRTADEAVAAARLDEGSAWTFDVAEASFAGRTTSADEFSHRLALDCGLLAVQRSSDGAERLLLAAWTGPRLALVIQATDGPSAPYDDAVRVDLLSEQPWGEWVDEGVWAVSLQGGESVVIGTVDFSLGATAKSWLAGFPEPPAPPPETDVEAYAITVLEAAGARNVGLAEPSRGTVAVIAFSTPLGNVMIATVGGPDLFDPTIPVLSGESSVETVGTTVLRVTLPGPDEYTVAEAGFTCGPYGWRLESGFGTPAEVRDWALTLIVALGC